MAAADSIDQQERPGGFLGRCRESLTDGAAFPFLMIVPPLLVLGLVIGVPLGKAVLLSFDRVILTRPELAGHFTLYNYVRLIGDETAWLAVWRTCIYMFGTVCGSILLGLSAALLTRRIVRWRGLVRTAFIIPWSIPAIVTALVWGVMYDSNFGVLNRLLSMLPFRVGRVEWLLDQDIVMFSLVAAQVWNEFPVAYIFFLAGLQGIPEEFYEAAEVDGAGRFQQFWYITLPQIRYVLAVIVVLQAIFGLRAFPIIQLLTGGRIETLTVKTFNAAFRQVDFSYASTIGLLAVVVSLALVLIYLRLTLRRGSRDDAS